MLNFNQKFDFRIKILLILICIGAEIQQSTAQQKNIDTLFDVLKTTKTDTIRIKTLYFLSDEFYQKVADMAINF